MLQRTIPLVIASWLLLSSCAIAQSSNDQLRLTGNFTLVFHVHQEDIRSSELRGVQLQYYKEVHSEDQSHPNIVANISSVEHPVNYTLTISSSPEDFQYRLADSNSSYLFSYNKPKNESYIYQINPNSHIFVEDDFSYRDLPFIPCPAVGLNQIIFFTSNNPLVGKVSGLGLLPGTGNLEPATATILQQSSVAKCTSCTTYFNGTTLPRDVWAFNNFFLFANKYIARQSVCTSYFGYNPHNAVRDVPTISSPLTRTTYTLLSASIPHRGIRYNFDTVLKRMGTGSDTSVEYFKGNTGLVTFFYKPGDGTLDEQEQNALGVQSASASIAGFTVSKSAAFGIISVLFITIAAIAMLIRKRRHQHNS